MNKIIQWLHSIITNLEIIRTCEANREELEAWNMEGKNIVYFEVKFNQGWDFPYEFWIYVEVVKENEYKIIGMGDDL